MRLRLKLRNGIARRSRRSLVEGACLAVFLLVVTLFAAWPASAATVVNREMIGTFDGSDTSGGKFSRPVHIAVHDATGTVYVTDEHVLDRFNAAGEAQNFPCTGQSSLSYGSEDFTRVAVDNSEANPGRIYLATAGAVKAISPCGEFLPWELELPSPAVVCGIAVDAEGHLWVSDEANGVVREFDNTGSPPAQIGEVQDFSGTEEPCRIALDQEGNLYIGQTGGGGFEAHSVDKYIGGSFDSVLDPYSPNGIAIDQTKAAGSIFVARNGNFVEYKAGGVPVWSYGEGVNGEAVIGLGGSDIAYYPAADRVYVVKGGTDKKVFIFDSQKTAGTAPDLTINKTVSPSIETAHLSGTINPLGLENSYHFEYKSGNEPSWTPADEEPAPGSSIQWGAVEHINPPDSTTHTVSLDLSGLKPFTQYQARLVATNDEAVPHVVNISPVDRFRTGKFAELTICDPSEVTLHSVHICGTVDPKETDASWRFQASAHPECLSGKGFVDHPSHAINANSGVTPVEETLTGLLSAQLYCVRLAATNSPGTAYSEIKQFSTEATAPVVETRGAAPRTQTSARLNAFVNPENADTTFHFEYSEDGGASWIARPDRTLPAGSTTSLLVSEELEGLEPATSYWFRVVAKNEVNGVPRQAQSTAQAFATLPEPPSICPNEVIRLNRGTTYLGGCRGVELVNEPDKGNQNVISGAPPVGASQIGRDGNELLWWVLGGAPGAPSGALSTFLAQRTSAGWQSDSIVPPAEEQFGGGTLTYRLNGVTPDLRSFVFGVRASTALDSPPPPTVVRIRDGVQDVLKTYVGEPPNAGWETTFDLTDDSAHVLFIDVQSKQLEDIGAARVATGESPEIPGEVISIMPDGVPSECGLDPFNRFSFANFAQPGYHWIGSEDASRVYFRVQPNADEAGKPSCGNPARWLYMRDRDASETTLIDASDSGFVRATPDGQHAYFVTTSNHATYEALTPTEKEHAANLDPAEEDANANADVYRWSEESGSAACLTCVVSDASVTSFESVLVSDDYSHIYFVSKNQLVPGQGKQGQPNLYVLTAGDVRFVGPVGSENPFSGEGNQPRLSEDGDVLLFRAIASPGLTSDMFQSKPRCLFPKISRGLGTCSELYRYDDRDRSVECLSCDHADTTTHMVGTPSLGGGEFDFGLSADGGTAAFATAEALLGSDVNNDTDIYEWRDGAVHLVTDGVSAFQEGPSAPRVIGLDADGGDLFFAVVPPGGSLTGFEQDAVSNLYDARIEGGFEPPPPSEGCAEESCQGPLQASPGALSAASSRFEGRGNVEAPKAPCRKGKVRRHGRCVKPHKRRHRRHHRRRADRAGQGRAK